MARCVPFAASFSLLVWIWYEQTVFFRAYGLAGGWTVVRPSFLMRPAHWIYGVWAGRRRRMFVTGPSVPTA